MVCNIDQTAAFTANHRVYAANTSGRDWSRSNSAPSTNEITNGRIIATRRLTLDVSGLISAEPSLPAGSDRWPAD